MNGKINSRQSYDRSSNTQHPEGWKQGRGGKTEKDKKRVLMYLVCYMESAFLFVENQEINIGLFGNL